MSNSHIQGQWANASGMGIHRSTLEDKMHCIHCHGTIREFELDIELAERDPDASPAKQIGPDEYIHLGCEQEYRQEAQAELDEQETDLPDTLSRVSMLVLQVTNLYFIVGGVAEPNYRWCRPDAPVYHLHIGAWRRVDREVID